MAGGLLLFVGGCASDPAPDALVSYLEDLVAGDLSGAYRRTQLSEVDAFTRTSALSEDHFVSFFRADPVLDYDIGRVIAYRPEGQDAFWEIEVTLRTRSGSRTEDVQVEGEVLGVVTVQPVQLFVQVEDDGVPAISIDGFPVDVSAGKVAAQERTWQVLVLDGSHVLSVNGDEVRFVTEPPRVISGRASVDAGPAGRVTIRVPMIRRLATDGGAE